MCSAAVAVYQVKLKAEPSPGQLTFPSLCTAIRHSHQHLISFTENKRTQTDIFTFWSYDGKGRESTAFDVVRSSVIVGIALR